MGRVKDNSILEETETTTASINDMEGALKGLGIALRDTTSGDFRDTSEVLGELSEKWQGMSKAEQSYIAELGAGVRQKNIFLALMESMSGEAERYSSLLGEATNAEGASADAQEIYMESLEAKMNALKATTTEMWQSLINSNVIGGFIEVLNTFVTAITKVANMLNGMGKHTVPIVVGLSTAFVLLGKNTGGLLGKIISLKAGFVETKGKLFNLVTGTKGASKQMQALSADAEATVTTMRTLASALGGIVVGVGISLLVTAIDNIANSAKKAKEEFQEMVSSFEEEASRVTSIEKLITEQEELNVILEGNTGTNEELLESVQRLEEVEKQIADLLPGATDAWTVYGEAKASNIEINKELLESEKETLKQTLENTAIGGETIAKNAETAMRKAVEGSEDAKQKILEYQKAIDDLESKRGTKGNSDFMLDRQISDYTSKIESLRGEIRDYGETISENESTVNTYNKTIKKLNEEHGTSYDTVSSLSDVYKQLSISKGELAEETERLTEAVEKERQAQEKIEGIVASSMESMKSSFASYEDGKKAMDDLIEKSNEYRSIVKDIIDENGNFDPDKFLTASTIQDIINNHQELVGYLDDEQALYDYIVQALQNFGQEAGQAYQLMMANSEAYFSASIKGTANWEDFTVKVHNNLSKLNSDYYRNNAVGMQKELNNAQTLAQARATLEANCAKTIAQIWQKYYSTYEKTVEQRGFKSSFDRFSDFKNMTTEINETKNAYAQLIADLEKLPSSIKVPNSITNAIGSITGSNSTANKNTVDDLDLQIDRYYKLQKAIKDVNHELELNQSKQETATGREKIKLIEEEIALLEKQKRAYQDLRAEQLRERNELKGSIGNHGFNVDSNNQITNYNQRLKELENWANSASGDTKKERQESVKKIKELVDAYISLNEAIQGTDETIADFNGQIHDNKEEMKDYYSELLDQVQTVEDKITEALEKEIEKRRKAIEDEYNLRVKTLQKTKDLYNKANEEEDYKNELATEQSKLTELQNAINVAMRDTSNAGKARLAELQKQYQEQQSKIEGMITDHERDKANERFDEEIENAEAERDKALESFDAKYDEKAIAQMVTELIANGWTQIGDEIIDVENLYKDFEDTFGDGMTILGEKIKEEFIASLKEAQEVLKNMDDIYSRLGLTTGFNATGTREGSKSISTFSLGGTTSAEGAPMMARATTNPGLAQESIGTAVLGRAKSLEDIQVMGDTISTVNVSFDSLVNVEGNVMKDLIPQLNDVVKQAVKEMDKTLTNNLKSRLGQL